ncbi:TetR/AcrR family transcriptional regulator [Frankia sp. AgPm24]|uniref:TetR/AcrR family transcriptional regulator n=1 Tax=Frankia umida TaxID=573489 RepID=A0ABT0JX44_9ACTN|nr:MULTISPECIES: TetR/AcrR family transcriptional regulator [Frankia]MCK9876120.1 TetR/AcrR family transcriptional regulator [Frankia umida]MCK9922832.1 TetR/AcrR family transcriptional regulator [Frankia sp. AgPm24]
MASTSEPATERPVRSDARRNRERVLAAAREAFTEVGPEVSLAEVARRAGVGQGTLYRHFPARADLLGAILVDGVATLCRRGAELAAAGPAGAALAGWLGLLLEHARVNQGLAGSYLSGGGLGERYPVTDCHEKIMGMAARLLADAQRTGAARADLTAVDLVQLIVGISLVTVRTQDSAQADRLLAVALDGVRVGMATGRP